MDVFRSALSLVIHKNANVTVEDVDDLVERYRVKKGISLDKDRYWQAVRNATEHYQKQEYCLFVCTDSRCLAKTYINPSNKALQALSRELDCPVEPTGCHWQCDDAPVLTLKVGDHSYAIPDCSSEDALRAARVSIRNYLSRYPGRTNVSSIAARSLRRLTTGNGATI